MMAAAASFPSRVPAYVAPLALPCGIPLATHVASGDSAAANAPDHAQVNSHASVRARDTNERKVTIPGVDQQANIGVD